MAAPKLTIDFDAKSKALQVGHAGIPVTLSGPYSVTAQDSVVDGYSASLGMGAVGSGATPFSYGVKLNADGTWSSSLNTPVDGALTATVTLSAT